MAVASLLLERNVDTQEREFTKENRDIMSADERHNSLISENYARLINPESRPKDIIMPVQRTAEAKLEEVKATAAEPVVHVREVAVQKPYLVENARADADIFRADSPVNRKIAEASEVAAVSMQAEEEENEDLRPTQTTIQYKTAGVKKTVEEGKIGTRSVRVKLSALTKKDKIIIAVALSVIIALFILIIVNSAVISKLSVDVDSLQTSYTEVETTVEETRMERGKYSQDSEYYRQMVDDFAIENGLVLR